jgi:hypothetical protein
MAGMAGKDEEAMEKALLELSARFYCRLALLWTARLDLAVAIGRFDLYCLGTSGHSAPLLALMSERAQVWAIAGTEWLNRVRWVSRFAPDGLLWYIAARALA